MEREREKREGRRREILGSSVEREGRREKEGAETTKDKKGSFLKATESARE